MTTPTKAAKGKGPLVDHNRHVVKDAIVDGVFSQKGDHFMVVAFDFEGHACSGILHVSQFNSKRMSERDAMFAAATVGAEIKGLRVSQVLPPPEGGKFRLTVVRLTAREDFDPAIFEKTNIFHTYRGEKLATTDSDPASRHMDQPLHSSW